MLQGIDAAGKDGVCCHVIAAMSPQGCVVRGFKQPTAEERGHDMLDLAFGLTQTSRLGCQIIMTEELDGLTVRLPSATRNMMKA